MMMTSHDKPHCAQENQFWFTSVYVEKEQSHSVQAEPASPVFRCAHSYFLQRCKYFLMLGAYFSALRCNKAPDTEY